MTLYYTTTNNSINSDGNLDVEFLSKSVLC